MPASARLQKPNATYEDILTLPPHMTGQIVGGELHVSPRPANRHALASSQLGADVLLGYGRGRGGPGGWWILIEPELHLGPDILVPDIAGWRQERLPLIPAGNYFTLAPDWICEVLSPSTASFDRIKKMRVYAREGVRHAWIVDPAGRSLEVYRLGDAGYWLLIGGGEGDENVRMEPFEEIEIELSNLWIPQEPVDPVRSAEP